MLFVIQKAFIAKDQTAGFIGANKLYFSFVKTAAFFKLYFTITNLLALLQRFLLSI